MGSNPAEAVCGNFLYPTLPVSFGRDTKSRWSLLSGVYARGSKRSHQSALEMCNLSWTPPPTLRNHTSSWTTLEISLKTFVCYPVNRMCSKSNQSQYLFAGPLAMGHDQSTTSIRVHAQIFFQSRSVSPPLSLINMKYGKLAQDEI